MDGLRLIIIVAFTLTGTGLVNLCNIPPIPPPGVDRPTPTRSTTPPSIISTTMLSRAPSVASTHTEPTTRPTTIIATATPNPTTVVPTTEKPTTVAPTTEKSTTIAPTTQENSTMAPTTQRPTTVAPTTPKPTTVTPTTLNPTTVAPTTPNPTTLAPATLKPTTGAPTTPKPTTVAPTTPKPTTVAPTTLKPTTLAPTTLKPTTLAPTTPKQTTVAPTTLKPTTLAPTTPKQTTLAPTTPKQTTVAPTTLKPTTVAPTTPNPTTVAPTTLKPTTLAPTTPKPTMVPTTKTPTTIAPTDEPPDRNICGLSQYYSDSPSPPGAAIIGGSTTRPNEYPWLARVLIAGSSVMCQAIILDSRHLLSMPPCLEYASPISGLRIHFADHDTEATDDGEFVRSASEIIAHPNWNPALLRFHYNFAVIRLSDPLDFSSWKVQPICLPASCDDDCPAGGAAYLAGWGRTSYYGGNSRYLQHGHVTIAEQSVCEATLGTWAHSTIMCAGTLGGVGICYGDAAAPLMTKEGVNFKLCGLGSLLPSGCSTTEYSGFSKVCSVVDWIQSVMNFEYSPPTTTALATVTAPVQSDCGHSQYFYNTNQPGIGIVGGTTARPNEYPWIARLSMGCGATIISENYLLTAAHCVDHNPSSVTAYIAEHDRYSYDSGQFSVVSTSYTIHPQYGPSNDYDFALLRLQTPLNFTSSWTVQKACLPRSCSANCKEGYDAYIAGWGTLSSGGSSPRELQHAKVPIQSRTLCAEQYYYTTITDRMLCAGYVEGGTDTCQGDSGGPLLTIENGAYMLCGVTSWGMGCAYPNYFGVYGNVCSVISWIKSTAGIA